MDNPITKLKNRVLGNKNKQTTLTPIIKMIKELGCFSNIVGANFEVYDANDKLVYKIKQKPIALSQMNNLWDEMLILEKLENDSNKKGKLPKKGRK